MNRGDPGASRLQDARLPMNLTAAAIWILTLVSAIIFLDLPVPLWVSYLLGGIFLALCLGSLALFFLQAGAARLPDGRRSLREFSQWSRWQACLFFWPAIMSNLVILAVGRDWAREGGSSSLIDVILLALTPLYALLVTSLILPRRSEGGPDFFTRWRNEDLNDELSREHGRTAFRTGYTLALLGLALTLIAGTVAPDWVVEAALGAVWLAFVGMCVRFGLLQRAAEPRSDDE